MKLNAYGQIFYYLNKLLNNQKMRDQLFSITFDFINFLIKIEGIFMGLFF